MDGFLTINEACAAIGVKRTKMYELMKDHFLDKGESFKYNKRRWFSKVAIDKYVTDVIKIK